MAGAWGGMPWGGGVWGGGMFGTPAHFFEDLISLAERAIGEGQCQLAVVLAQAGCEVRTEQAFDQACRMRGIPDLASALGASWASWDLGNGRLRKVYEALTGDRSLTAPVLWEPFRTHRDRRNAVVHDGANVTPAEAEASVAACRALVQHLDQVIADLATQRP